MVSSLFYLLRSFCGSLSVAFRCSTKSVDRISKACIIDGEDGDRVFVRLDILWGPNDGDGYVIL